MSSKISLADKTAAYREPWTGLDRTSPYAVEDKVSKFPVEVVLEKDVCKELRTYWKAHGYFYIRNQQGLGSKRGTADYTIVHDGRTVFVEAKATKGKQSPHQIEFQAELEAVGGSYYLVRSVKDFISEWEAARIGGRRIDGGL